ncbi:MAG: hypothetical protein EP344_15940 [Bacteroidetes bacterium]|nr:MAG: hypothetical protein EP344_15940 [Bacteroidota bacterium]
MSQPQDQYRSDPERKLAAIMFTDIVGYSAMMQKDEATALEAVNRYQDVLEDSVKKYHGELLHYYGDGSLCIFSSTLNAVKAAMEIQISLKEEPAVPLRVGLHIGEVSFEDGKVLGDGINIASRIESMGQPGTVMFSQNVYEKIRNRQEFQVQSLGSFRFKNIREPLEVYALSNPGFPVPKRSSLRGKLAQDKTFWRRMAVLVLVAAVFGFVGANLNDWMHQEEQRALPRKQYQLLLPETAPVDVDINPNGVFSTRSLDIAPAGDILVYVGQDGNSHALFVRKTDSWDSRMLPGTEGAFCPFFSPDGQWVGFYADKKLKKIPVRESNPVPIVLCEVTLPYGAAWGPDNTILFSNNEGRALAAVSADGGQPEYILDVRSTSLEQYLTGYHFMSFLPGGRYVLIADEDDFMIILDRKTLKQTLLPFRGNNPVFVEPGYLVYTRFERLFAVPFDPDALRTAGSPVLVAANVKTNGIGTSQCALSRSGTLAYINGLYEKYSRLVQVFRNGKKKFLSFPANNHGTFQVSPDGRKIAIEITAFNSDELWIYDMEQGKSTKLTHTGNNYGMAWTPDGSAVAFLSQRDGGWGLYRKSIQGTTPAEKLSDLRFRPYCYAPNGEWVIGSAQGVSALHLGDSITFLPIAGSDGNATTSQPMITPDGKWLLYHSDETGIFEIYVQAFPPDGRRWQVTNGGGGSVMCPASGGEIFYEDRPHILVSPMRINSGGQPAFGAPESIFEGDFVQVGGHDFCVMPDGQSILILESVDTTSLFTEIRVVEHWLEGL